MMGRGLVVSIVVIGLAIAGCSTSSKSSALPSACADISGNYSVEATFMSGTCDPKLFSAGASSVSFAKAADGTWNIILAAVPGGCPGTLDPASCHFTANCQASADGGVEATFSFDFTFTAGGFTGSDVGGLHPPAVPSACTATFQEKGTKL